MKKIIIYMIYISRDDALYIERRLLVVVDVVACCEKKKSNSNYNRSVIIEHLAFSNDRWTLISYVVAHSAIPKGEAI